MKSKNTKTPPRANRVRRGPNKSKSSSESDAELAARLLKDGWANDEAHAAHVAKLVKRGVVILGKGGPLPEELFRPGPRAPGALKALRWTRDHS